MNEENISDYLRIKTHWGGTCSHGYVYLETPSGEKISYPLNISKKEKKNDQV